MFFCGEKVVYPGHGVAVIEEVIEKKIAGTITPFFRLRFLSKEIIILVPVANVKNIGIRALADQEDLKSALDRLASPFNGKIKDPNGTNWSKRNKEFQARLMNGNLIEICEIYRELKSIEVLKELSFGEKNLLAQTEDLLVEEIVIISGKTKEQVLQKLHALVGIMRQLTSQAITQKQLL